MTIAKNSPRALGYQQATVDTATALTIPAGTDYFIMTCTAQACRWRDDGTDPTATIGYPVAINVEMRYDSGSMSRIKFISQTAGSIINVCYYGS